MYCKDCGKVLQNSDKFCSGCGTRVELTKEQESTLEPTKKTVEFNPENTSKDDSDVVSDFKMDSLSWDLEPFVIDPATEEKKEEPKVLKKEKADFIWDSVIEDQKDNSKDLGTLDWTIPEETKEIKVKDDSSESKEQVAEDDIEAHTEALKDTLKANSSSEESKKEETSINYVAIDTEFIKKMDEEVDDIVEESLEEDEFIDIEDQNLRIDETIPAVVPITTMSWEEDVKAAQEDRVDLSEVIKIPEKNVTSDTIEVTKSVKEDLYESLLTEEDENEEFSKTKIDKFYTFNQKNEEFQELLDKEYERLRKRIEDEATTDKELKAKFDDLMEELGLMEKTIEEKFDMDKDDVSEISLDELDDVDMEGVISEEEKEKEPTTSEILDDVESTIIVDQPAMPIDIVAEEVQEYKNESSLDIVEDIQFPKAEDCEVICEEDDEKCIKDKKSYEGIFSDESDLDLSMKEKWTSFTSTFLNLPKAIEEEEKKQKEAKETAENIKNNDKNREEIEEPKDNEEKAITTTKKSAIVLDFIIIVLSILIIAVAAGMFFPDTMVGKEVNKYFSTVTTFFTGNEPVVENPPVEEPKENDGVQKAIEKGQKEYTQLGKIDLDKNLIFDTKSDYGNDQISKSLDFKDTQWFSDKKGHPISYGNAIVSAALKYYADYQNLLNEGDKDILSIVTKDSDLYKSLDETQKSSEKLSIKGISIGEIRRLDGNYFILVKVKEKYGNKDVSEKIQTLTMTPGDKAMSIDSVADKK